MWWTGGALGFDTETDGVDPTDARIITAGLVSMTPGNQKQEMPELMLEPERDIPEGAIKTHGITTERARDEGMPREMGLAQISTTIAELAGPERPLVAHNASYDLTVLDRELRRTGLGWLEIERNLFAQLGQVRMILGGSPVTTFPVIDTYVLDKAVDRYRQGKRQLSHAAAFYGVPMEDGAAHGATADAIASLRIAITIASRCKVAAAGDIATINRLYADRRQPADMARSLASIGALSLPELHAAQIRWAAEQAEGLREYFMKSGTADPDGVDGSWPLRQLRADEATEVVDTTLI